MNNATYQLALAIYYQFGLTRHRGDSRGRKAMYLVEGPLAPEGRLYVAGTWGAVEYGPSLREGEAALILAEGNNSHPADWLVGPAPAVWEVRQILQGVEHALSEAYHTGFDRAIQYGA